MLIAEDHEDIRRLLCLTLDRSGVDVVTAANGDEALELARRAHPQVLVTDLLMPGRDGRELVLALRAEREFAALPVLILTANPHHPAALELGQLPNIQIMGKPPSWSQVVLAVRAMLTQVAEASPG